MAPTSNTITPLRRLLVVAAAGGALVVAGCGSDDGEQSAAPPAGQETATLRVTETDFAIEPANARAEPGTVTVAVTNRGEAPHALAIETPEGVVETPMLGAGESGEVEADLAAGTYTWYCPVGDHRARGMEGSLDVGSTGGGDSGGSEPPAEAPTRGYGY